MTQSDFILQAVLAMNTSGDIDPNFRVTTALIQLEELVKTGIEFDETQESEPVKKLLNSDPFAEKIIGGR